MLIYKKHKQINNIFQKKEVFKKKVTYALACSG